MAYNRWAPYQNELYHHGVKGMRWGVRRDRPRGAGKYIRGMKRDLTLLNEREYNQTRKALGRDIEYGKIDYYKYNQGIQRAKFRYQSKKAEIKHLKQTKSKEETRKDFEQLRAKAIREVPHYRLKSGVKTVNKILTGLAVGSLAISTGAYASGVAFMGANYGAAAAIAVGKAAAAGIGLSGGVSAGSHYLRTRTASALT